MDRREAIRRLGLLTGGVLSFSTVSAVLGGCRVVPGESWEPVVLVGDLSDLVASIAERIIPETDTPGARAAQVHHFIDRVAADWMVRAEREHFLDQLEAFQEETLQEFGRPFPTLDAGDQIALLQRAEHLALGVEPSGQAEEITVEVELPGAWDGEREPGAVVVPGTGQRERIQVRLRPWFRTMKELTVVGYYTSEIGATQELQYEHVPGRWVPCAPLEEIGRSWA